MARLAALVSALLLVGPAAAADVPKLVKQLGSPDFRDREAASRDLEAVGAPALPALRAALTADDEEVARRAADVIDRITRRATNDRLLTPTLVELPADETTVGDALARLEKETGYRLQPAGSTLDALSAKVKPKAGKVPFWDAVRAVCDPAGLEVGAVVVSNPARAIVYDNSFGGPGRRSFYDPPSFPTPSRAGPIVVRRSAAPAPVSTAGAVWLTADHVPEGARAAVPADVVPVVLEAVPEPKLRWERIESVRVTKAVDDAGRRLSAHGDDPADATKARDAQVTIDPTGRIVVASREGPGVPQLVSTATRAVVRLKAGDGPPHSLKEFEGVVRAVVWAGPDEVAAVAGLDANRQPPPATGPHGFVLKAEAVGEGKGTYDLDVEIGFEPTALQAPDYGRVPGTTEWYVSRGGRGRLMLRQAVSPGSGGGSPAAATELGGLRVADADGRPFAVTSEGYRRFIDFTGRTTDTIRLTVRPSVPGQGKPAKVTFSGTRAVTVEVPFKLTGVPVAAGAGPIPDDR